MDDHNNHKLKIAVSDLLLANKIDHEPEFLDAVTAVLVRTGGMVRPDEILKLIPTSMAASASRSKKILSSTMAAQLNASSRIRGLSLAATPLSPRASATGGVIFVAIDIELQATLGQLQVKDELLVGGTVVYSAVTKAGNPLMVAKTGQGNSQASSVVASVLSGMSADHAIFAGIAGALYDIPFETVIVASYVYDYESQESGLVPKSRAKSIGVDHLLGQIASSLIINGIAGIADIRSQPIASGEKLIRLSSGDVYDWITLVGSDASVVEMEGLGFLKACTVARVPALVVRGVSDHLSDKTGTGDRTHQPMAAAAAASVAIAISDRKMDFKNRNSGNA